MPTVVPASWKEGTLEGESATGHSATVLVSYCPSKSPPALFFSRSFSLFPHRMNASHRVIGRRSSDWKERRGFLLGIPLSFLPSSWLRIAPFPFSFVSAECRPRLSPSLVGVAMESQCEVACSHGGTPNQMTFRPSSCGCSVLYLHIACVTLKPPAALSLFFTSHSCAPTGPSQLAPNHWC